MNLPYNIQVKIDKNLFKQYLFNFKHRLGKYRADYFKGFNVSENIIEYLIEELKKIPREQTYTHTKVLYKIGFIYRFEFISSVFLETKKYYIKTIWVYKENSFEIELINFILL
jgi:hypothetical protein